MREIPKLAHTELLNQAESVFQFAWSPRMEMNEGWAGLPQRPEARPIKWRCLAAKQIVQQPSAALSKNSFQPNVRKHNWSKTKQMQGRWNRFSGSTFYAMRTPQNTQIFRREIKPKQS